MQRNSPTNIAKQLSPLFSYVGFGIVIGAVLTWILLSAGAKIGKLDVLGIEFSLPEESTKPQPAASDLTGVWSISGSDSGGSHSMTVAFTQPCSINRVCGVFFMPAISCTGTFTLLEVQNDIYEFRAGDKTGPCAASEGRDFFEKLPNGNLMHRVITPGNDRQYELLKVIVTSNEGK